MARRSNTRSFVDEGGSKWLVMRYGFASFAVEPDPRPSKKLHDVARNCAKKLNVLSTSDGTPLEYVNEHSRIWNKIWKYGQDVN